MSRHVIQAALLVTTALALAACAVPSDTEPDTGQAEEEAEEQALPLPHTGSFKIHGLLHVGPFNLPNRGTLTVIIKAEWSSPSCPNLAGYLEPARKRLIVGYTDVLERRPFAAGRSPQLQRWTGLEGGRYRLDIDVPNRPGNCELLGTITVSSP